MKFILIVLSFFYVSFMISQNSWSVWKSLGCHGIEMQYKKGNYSDEKSDKQLWHYKLRNTSSYEVSFDFYALAYNNRSFRQSQGRATYAPGKVMNISRDFYPPISTSGVWIEINNVSVNGQKVGCNQTYTPKKKSASSASSTNNDFWGNNTSSSSTTTGNKNSNRASNGTSSTSNNNGQYKQTMQTSEHGISVTQSTIVGIPVDKYKTTNTNEYYTQQQQSYNAKVKAYNDNLIKQNEAREKQAEEWRAKKAKREKDLALQTQLAQEKYEKELENTKLIDDAYESASSKIASGRVYEGYSEVSQEYANQGNVEGVVVTQAAGVLGQMYVNNQREKAAREAREARERQERLKREKIERERRRIEALEAQRKKEALERKVRNQHFFMSTIIDAKLPIKSKSEVAYAFIIIKEDKESITLYPFSMNCPHGEHPYKIDVINKFKSKISDKMPYLYGPYSSFEEQDLAIKKILNNALNKDINPDINSEFKFENTNKFLKQATESTSTDFWGEENKKSTTNKTQTTTNFWD